MIAKAEVKVDTRPVDPIVWRRLHGNSCGSRLTEGELRLIVTVSVLNRY